MSGSALIDAHHHLWDLEAIDYPWLRAKGVRRFFGDPTPIQKNYRAEDLQTDAAELGLAASVHIQVGAAPGAEIAETQWLDSQARATGLPSAIVAFADLTAPNLEATLDAHAAASARFVGVRQIVSRHPDEDAASAAPPLLSDPRFKDGLRLLLARGLRFDLQLTAPLLLQAAEVFGEVPDLPVALCHQGSLWDRGAEAFAAWRHGIVAFAALPNSVVKLSGYGMFDPCWTADSIRPLVDRVIEAFGPARVMWGSNHPVERLARSYRDTLAGVRAAVPEHAHAEVFAGTARRFYALG